MKSRKRVDGGISSSSSFFHLSLGLLPLHHSHRKMHLYEREGVTAGDGMRSNQREQPQQQWQQEKPGSTMTATACIWDPHGCEWREREESRTACDSTQTRAERSSHREQNFSSVSLTAFVQQAAAAAAVVHLSVSSQSVLLLATSCSPSTLSVCVQHIEPNCTSNHIQKLDLSASQNYRVLPRNKRTAILSLCVVLHRHLPHLCVCVCV